MKYFWKFLMGHNNFSYVLLSFFFFFFWVTSFQKLWGSEDKMLELAIKGIFKKNKTFFKISKIHLVIWEMLVKMKVKNFSSLLLWSSSSWWGKGYILLWQILLRILCLFDAISSEIIWIEKLDYFHEGIYFPNNDCHGNKKRQFFSYHSNGCYYEKNFFKNVNFVGSNHHCKNWVDRITVGWDKISQLKERKLKT